MQIALSLGVSGSQVSRDLAVMARRDVKWYRDNAHIRQRLERYFKENLDRFNHILNQAYDLYHDPDSRNKPTVRLAALNLAKSCASDIARHGGVPDFQLQGFVDQLEGLAKEVNEMRDEQRQNQKVKPLAPASSG